MTDTCAKEHSPKCWPWRHKWTKWSDVMRDHIIYPDTKVIAGIIFIQKRTCKECGFTEYNRQRIMAGGQ